MFQRHSPMKPNHTLVTRIRPLLAHFLCTVWCQCLISTNRQSAFGCKAKWKEESAEFFLCLETWMILEIFRSSCPPTMLFTEGKQALTYFHKKCQITITRREIFAIEHIYTKVCYPRSTIQISSGTRITTANNIVATANKVTMITAHTFNPLLLTISLPSERT